MFNQDFAYFKAINNHFLLDLKYICSKPSFYLMVSFFLLISNLLTMTIFPLYVFSGVQIGFSIGITSGIIYADIHYNWRKSTLYKNSITNGIGKSQLHLSTYLTIFLLETIISIILLLSIFIFNIFGLELDVWAFGDDENLNGYLLSYMDFFAYFWSVFWFFTIMFSISFVFQKFIKSINTYYTLLFIIFLLMFLFGGFLNDYFNSYDDNGEITYVIFSSDTYPESFFWLSLLFPFYGPGQVGSMVFDSIRLDNHNDFLWWQPSQVDFPKTWIKFQPFNLAGGYKFDIMIISPIIWTMILGILGSVIPNKF